MLRLTSSLAAAQFEVDLATQKVLIFEGEQELPTFDVVTEKIGKTGKEVRSALVLRVFEPVWRTRRTLC